MKDYKKMKYYQKTAFMAILAAIFLLCVNSTFAQNNSFNDALSKAKEDNKRVIVDIYTDWCGWCKKMDADAYKNKDIKELIEDNFVFVKLNAEGNKKLKYNGKEMTETDLAILFQATGYPTTVFLEPDGKIIEYKYDKISMNNLPGYFKASDFKKILKFIKDGKYNDTDLSTIIN